MSILRIKNSKGEWVDIPAIKGADGKDGEVTLEQLKSITGELENLPTEDKSNLVNAINEISKTAGGFIDVTSNLNIREIEDGLYVNKTTSNKTITVAPNSTTFRDFILRPGGYFIKTTSNNIIYGYIFDYYYGYMISFFKSSSDSNMDYISKYVASLISSDENKDNITGVHTYTTLPESSTVPTKDNQFVNKAYVDGITGSLDDLSTEDKTNLVNAINEVFAGLSSSESDIEGITKLTKSTDLQQQFGLFQNTSSSDITITFATRGTATSFTMYTNEIILSTNVRYATTAYQVIVAFTTTGFKLYLNNFGGGSSLTMNWDSAVKLSGSQTISGLKTFTALPKSSVAPTEDDHLVNKKYVDDVITTSITTVLEGEY